jgi:predicted outer membrane repeat protein
MWFSSLLRKPKRSGSVERRRSHESPGKRFTFRPQLEALEDRWMPSILTVTNNLDDSSAGSLRAEIAAAQNNDTIVFAPNLDGQTIGLTAGVLDINKSLTIQGPGAGQLTISANYTSQVLKVEATEQVSLSGLTISHGSTTGLGGGIDNYGNLIISACMLSNNVANGDGGGIYNEFGATLTVTNSTVSGNTADSQGGGIYSYGKLTITGSAVEQNNAINGGGIWNGDSATISSSTVSGNLAYGGDSNGYGGGIYNADSMSLIASTVTGNNSDGRGAGIYDQGWLTISSQSRVCNNFELAGPYSAYHEDNLDLGLYGHVKITGGSKVC